VTLRCDGCRLCCKLLDVAELPTKPHLGWCHHACKQGCAIYDSRPKSCQDYECLWLQSQTKPQPLSPDLRPDRIGVIFDATADGKGIVAHGDRDRLQRRIVQDFLSRLRSQGVTTIEASGDHYRCAKLGRGQTGTHVTLTSPVGEEVIPVQRR